MFCTLPVVTLKAFCLLQQLEDEEDEEEQEVLALPAPGDDLFQEGQMEAEMHAAIASEELADYAQVLCHFLMIAACITVTACATLLLL